MAVKANILVFISFLVKLIGGQPTMCVVDSCTHPKIAENYDPIWFRDTAPPDGWHMELGNKVARLHIAELIQGKLLTYDDDYTNMCGRVKLVHAEEATEGIDGNYYGFDGNQVDFQCHNSETEKGVIECDYSSTGLSKYSEKKVKNYLTYSDNKNLVIGVKCFANGENGWFTVSKTTSLSEDEKKLVLAHVKSLGFDTEDVVSMYNEKCKSETSLPITCHT